MKNVFNIREAETDQKKQKGKIAPMISQKEKTFLDLLASVVAKKIISYPSFRKDGV